MKIFFVLVIILALINFSLSCFKKQNFEERELFRSKMKFENDFLTFRLERTNNTKHLERFVKTHYIVDNKFFSFLQNQLIDDEITIFFKYNYMECFKNLKQHKIRLLMKQRCKLDENETKYRKLIENELVNCVDFKNKVHNKNLSLPNFNCFLNK